MVRSFFSYLIVMQLLIPMQAFAADDCGEGQVRVRGRCLQTAESVAQQNEYMKCLDKPEGERQACYDAKAKVKGDEQRVGDTGKKQGMLPHLSHWVAGITASAYVLTFWLTKMRQKSKRPTCKPQSMKWMTVGAMAIIATELTSLITYNSKLAKIRKRTCAEVNLDDDDVSRSSAMKTFVSRAYNDIIESEKAFKKSSTIRSIGYGAATAAFATAGVFAAIEIGHLTTAKTSDPPDFDTINKLTCTSGNLEDKVNEETQKEQTRIESDRRGPKIGSMLPWVTALLGGGGALQFLNKKPLDDPCDITAPEEETTMLPAGIKPGQAISFTNPFDSLTKEQQKNVYNLEHATNMDELDLLLEERNLLASGAISSPILVKKSSGDIWTDYSELDFEQIKNASIISEVFRGYQNLFELVGNDNSLVQSDI